MKVDAAEFAKAVRWVQGAGEWLGDAENVVLVEAGEGRLRLTTDRQTVWASVDVPESHPWADRPTTTKRWAAFVDIRRLKKAITLNKGTLSVRLADDAAISVAGKPVTVVVPSVEMAIPPRRVGVVSRMRSNPPLVEGKTRMVKVSVDALVEASQACSGDYARPILTCVSVRPEGICGTDSYRMNIRKVQGQDLPEMLLPRGGVALLPNLTDPEFTWTEVDEDGWLVAKDDRHTVAMFSANATQFPQWGKLVWKGPGDHYARFDDLSPLKALPTGKDIYAVVLEPSNGGIGMSLVGGYEKNISGEVTAWCAGEVTTKLALNPRFLRDLLTGVDTVRLRGSSKAAHDGDASIAPWKLAEDAPDGKRIRVLMPVRMPKGSSNP